MDIGLSFINQLLLKGQSLRGLESVTWEIVWTEEQAPIIGQYFASLLNWQVFWVLGRQMTWLCPLGVLTPAVLHKSRDHLETEQGMSPWAAVCLTHAHFLCL